MNTSTLLGRLTDAAKAQGIITDTALAQALKVTQPAVTHLRVGRRKPGVWFLHGVCAAFPDLKPMVMEYVETYQK